MTYERMLGQAFIEGILVYERTMPVTIKGLYSERTVWINREIETKIEKGCVLAEEIGHFYTASGDITDQSKISNRKQEEKGRSWAYRQLVPLSSIVQAHKIGIRNRSELADMLHVTEKFLDEALKRYQEKYGQWVSVGKYAVGFDPLGVLEWFDH